MATPAADLSSTRPRAEPSITTARYTSIFDNDKLQARGEIAPIRPPVRQNQYGFALGGPISIPKIYNGKNKSFFFFNFDQFKYTNAGAGSGLGTVADNQIRAGRFLAVPH